MDRGRHRAHSPITGEESKAPWRPFHMHQECALVHPLLRPAERMSTRKDSPFRFVSIPARTAIPGFEGQGAYLEQDQY